MRNNKSLDILDYFIKYFSHSFSTKDLSKTFGISERQVKNYIRQINQETAPDTLIIGTPSREYQLCENYQSYLYLFNYSEQLPKNRINNIISQLLLTNTPLDMFDLSDELYVSRSTLESDLSKIRRLLSDFDLVLQLKDDRLFLVGDEKSKRKLTSHMITTDQYSNFINDSKLKYLNNSYQASYIKQNLIEIFNECHFIFNDYSLNNIVLHLIITIDRIKKNCAIEDVFPSALVTNIERHAAMRVAAFLEVNFEITFSDSECQNLMLFLSCNLSTIDYNFVNSKIIAEYISTDSYALIKNILQKIQEYYYLEDFDDVFITRFTFHINNLLKRIHNNFSFRNPMTADIKHSYPLVYDIAVFAADIIYTATKYTISQDEISLIALHIGGFLESKQKNKNKFSALYIYSDYHSIYKYNIEKIQKRYDDIINIQYSISIEDYISSDLMADIIISEYPLIQNNVIQISPFITDKELSLIKERTEALLHQNSVKQFKQDLMHLFSEDLFFTEMYGKDEFEVIHKILDKMKAMDLFLSEFPDEVIKRERLSSTCFHNGIAIPHAISQQVTKSFISFSCLEKGQAWGSDNVKLVIVIGIAYVDRKIFRSVFDQLMNVFIEASYVQTISKCKTYIEVIDTIKQFL